MPRKLGIKEGTRLAIVAEPPGFRATLGDLPGAVSEPGGDATADVILCFVESIEDLHAGLGQLKPRLDWSGGLWFAWRKRRPGFTPTLDENTIREAGLASGLVDNKVCAIDHDWSGLRFVWRREDRPAAAGARARAGAPR